MHHGGGWRSFVRYDDTQAPPKVSRRLLRRVLAYGRPYLGALALMLLAITANSLLGLVPPLLYRELIDKVLPQRDMPRLNLLALGMIGIPLLTGLLSVGQRYLSSRTGEGIIFDLRQSLYTHVQRLSLRFFTHTKAGEILSRLNNDVVGAQSAVTGTLPNIITNLFTLVTTLVVMISIEWRLALLAVAVLPLFLLPARRVGRILRTVRRQAMEHNSDMSSLVSETLSINGALLVKAFGRQRQEASRYRDISGKVRDVGVRRALVGRWFFMGLGVAGALGTALIYWVGGHMVLDDALTVGTIVAFAAYLARLYGPISALSNVQVEFATSMVSFERVFEYLDLPVEIEDRADAVELVRSEGGLRFENVSFRYPGLEQSSSLADPADLHSEAQDAGLSQGSSLADPADLHSEAQDSAKDTSARNGRRMRRPYNDGEETAAGPVPTRTWAVRHLSFEIEPGQLVALVGPSGAGKTSVTYLLPRLYDPTGGRITLDGLDLRDIQLESLAAQMGMVTQETYLFHDTIRANLLYAKPEATQEELEAACRAAHVHDLIACLPEDYDTLVGERGYRFSGGEKQRLAIARVILMDPRILILDEATSHLDSTSEALIQQALEPLFAGRTSVVIAHRLSTILAADQILVLDEGRLVERGTHAELLEQDGLYAELYATQFRGNASHRGVHGLE